MLPAVPRPAFWLGAAGAVPFVVLAAATWLDPLGLKSEALQAQRAYGAVILSFLAAVPWGAALSRAEAMARPALGRSVALAVLGWVAQLMVPAPGLILLMLGFWAAFVADARAVAAGRLPLWYLQLRRPLSALAVAALGATLLAIWV